MTLRDPLMHVMVGNTNFPLGQTAKELYLVSLCLQQKMGFVCFAQKGQEGVFG